MQNRWFRSVESFVAGAQRGGWVKSRGVHCVSREFFNECGDVHCDA
jgi:hypothetical protein